MDGHAGQVAAGFTPGLAKSRFCHRIHIPAQPGPQQKQAQRHRQLVQSLKKGDEVITESGLVGSVISVNDDYVVLKAAENVKLKFLKSKVAGRTSDGATDKKK